MTAILLASDIHFLATWEPSQCHIALFHSSVNTELQKLLQISLAWRYQWHPINNINSNAIGLCSQSCIKNLQSPGSPGCEAPDVKPHHSGFPSRLACTRLLLFFCQYPLGTACWSNFRYFLLGTYWAFPCPLGICHLLLSISVSANLPFHNEHNFSMPGECCILHWCVACT